jgi:type VI secretion system secreted protein VgrG
VPRSRQSSGCCESGFRNRIFQQQTVPAILAEVLGGLDVRFAIAGQYSPRDYCVQYRESDFAFASRLMEEEGICYFFEHTATGHTMVVTDVPTTFTELPHQNRLIYSTVENAAATNRRVRDWEKQQDVVSGQYSARDHAFELQDHDLEYQQTLSGNVTVGTVSHTLAVGPAKDLTIADYPGRYAQRFDGVSAEGQAQADALAKVFDDGPRTVRIRMEQEAAESLKIRGAGDYSHLTPGYTFTLERHFDGNGDYLLTEVEHTVSIGDSYLTGEDAAAVYSNRFECIPKGLTYRPQRVTPQPCISGPQSATVVGPSGQQLYCDRYGRVKVRFRWDLAGKHDSRSSCWLRVAQPWAGQGFGSFHLPRVGQEVVVVFEEGDPDRPIIIGSVYNSQNPPPYQLPDEAMCTGLLSRSINGNTSNASEIRIVDNTPGKEEVHLHAERNLFISAEDQHQMQVGKGLYFGVGIGSSGSGSGGGSNGSDTTIDILGVEWDVAHGWKRSCGSLRDEILGNSFTFTLGATETVTIGAELDIYIGNYSMVVAGVYVEAYISKQFSFNLEEHLSASPSKSEEVALDYTIGVGGVMMTTVGGVMKTTVGGMVIMDVTAGGMVTKVIGGMITKVTGGAETSVTGIMKTTASKITTNSMFHSVTAERLCTISSDYFLSLTAEEKLQICCGDCEIKMGPTGITLAFGDTTLTLTANGIKLVCPSSTLAVQPASIMMTSPKITQVEA